MVVSLGEADDFRVAECLAQLPRLTLQTRNSFRNPSIEHSPSPESRRISSLRVPAKLLPARDTSSVGDVFFRTKAPWPSLLASKLPEPRLLLSFSLSLSVRLSVRTSLSLWPAPFSGIAPRLSLLRSHSSLRVPASFQTRVVSVPKCVTYCSFRARSRCRCGCRCDSLCHGGPRYSR